MPRSDYSRTINRHYGGTDLTARILDRLRAAGKDPATITRDDLAAFDEFHTGGRESTRALARLAGLSAGMRVLDVGCGIGGPARTLAAECDVQVVGLDLTEEFCRAATTLTDLVGLGDRVTFRQGDALAMPFGHGEFDALWSQNAVMNIPDHARLFGEMHRVLKPGGMLALEVVLAGPVEGVVFPTFWASGPEINFLMTPGTARALLRSAGFREVVWEDTTADTLAHARKRRPSRPDAAPALGRDTIVPEDVARKVENAVRNLEGERIRTARSILRRT